MLKIPSQIYSSGKLHPVFVVAVGGRGKRNGSSELCDICPRPRRRRHLPQVRGRQSQAPGRGPRGLLQAQRCM